MMLLPCSGPVHVYGPYAELCCDQVLKQWIEKGMEFTWTLLLTGQTTWHSSSKCKCQQNIMAWYCVNIYIYIHEYSIYIHSIHISYIYMFFIKQWWVNMSYFSWQFMVVCLTCMMTAQPIPTSPKSRNKALRAWLKHWFPLTRPAIKPVSLRGGHLRSLASWPLPCWLVLPYIGVWQQWCLGEVGQLQISLDNFSSRCGPKVPNVWSDHAIPIIQKIGSIGLV